MKGTLVKYLLAFALAFLPVASQSETLEAIQARVIPQQMANCFLDALGAPVAKEKATQSVQCIVAVDPKDPEHAVLFLADVTQKSTEVQAVWRWGKEGTTLLWSRNALIAK